MSYNVNYFPHKRKHVTITLAKHEIRPDLKMSFKIIYHWSS